MNARAGPYLFLENWSAKYQMWFRGIVMVLRPSVLRFDRRVNEDKSFMQFRELKTYLRFSF